MTIKEGNEKEVMSPPPPGRCGADSHLAPVTRQEIHHFNKCPMQSHYIQVSGIISKGFIISKLFIITIFCNIFIILFTSDLTFCNISDILITILLSNRHISQHFLRVAHKLLYAPRATFLPYFSLITFY